MKHIEIDFQVYNKDGLRLDNYISPVYLNLEGDMDTLESLEKLYSILVHYLERSSISGVTMTATMVEG